MESCEEENHSWSEGEESDYSPWEGDTNSEISIAEKTWTEEAISEDNYEEDSNDGDVEPEPPDQYRDDTSSMDWSREESHEDGEIYENESQSGDYDEEEIYGDNAYQEESHAEERPWHEIPYSDHEEEYHEETGSQISLEEASNGEEPEPQADFVEEEEVISEDGRDDSNPRYINYSGHDQGPEAYLRWERDMDEWFQENQTPKEERSAIAEDTLFGEAYLQWDHYDCSRRAYHQPYLAWEEMKSFLHYVFVEEPPTEPYYTKSDIPDKPERWITAAPLKKNFNPKPSRKTPTKPKEPIKNMPHVPNVKKKIEQAGQKQSIKEPQGELNVSSSSTFQEQPATPRQGKCSNTKLKDPTCYKCHKRGHYAATCPLKKLLEEKIELSKTSGNFVQNDLLNSNSSIMHLSLPKSFDPGTRPEKGYTQELEVVPTSAITLKSEAETSTREKESFKEKPPNQAKSVGQVSLSLNQFVSHDATAVLKSLLNIQEHEETPCLKPKLEEDFVVTSSKKQDSISLNHSKESIMHLFLVQSVNLKAGTKGVKHQEVTPGQRRGVIISHLLKGEPPDAPHATKPQHYQGKTLNSQRRMKANLLSLGADYIVSRSKPFQEREYDEDIKSKPTMEQGEGIPKLTTTLGQNQHGRTEDIGVLRGVYLPHQDELNYESTCSRNYTHQGTSDKKNWLKRFPHEEDMNFSSWRISKEPEVDQRLLIEEFQSNQDDKNCKPNCFGISTHQRHVANWIHTKIYFGSKVIQFMNQEIPGLPHLKAHGIKQLQTGLLTSYTTQKVPRHHLYLPKLSRYKETRTHHHQHTKKEK